MRRLLPLLLLLGCSSADPEPTPAPPPPATVAPAQEPAPDAVPPTPVAELVDDLDRRIAMHRGKAGAAPDTDWLHRGLAAELLLARQRLTGTWDEYAQAEQLLTDAFAVAAERSGPWMTRGRLHAGLHRLDAAAADFDRAGQRIVLDDRQRSALLLANAALLRQRGDLPGADALIAEAKALRPAADAFIQEGLQRWARGDFDGAEDRFRIAEGHLVQADATTLAWLDLQAGLLDLERERWADALAHYDDSLAHLSGWYLAEEHRAEALAELGRKDEAVGLYRDVVARTDHPELIGALAGLVDEPEAAQLMARATAGWEERLARWPEAAGGHAIEHFAAVDPARAEQLARANHALRPDAEGAATLASILVDQGKTDEARQVAQAALDRGFRRADLLEAAAAAGARVPESGP